MTAFTSAPPAADARRNTRLLAGAVLVIVALAGVLVGMGIDRLWFAGTTPRGTTKMTFSLDGPTPEQRRQRRDDMAHKLELSASQRVQLDSIMDRGALRFDALREEIRPRVQTLVNDVRNEIETVLAPDQLVKFRVMRADSGKSK